MKKIFEIIDLIGGKTFYLIKRMYSLASRIIKPMQNNRKIKEKLQKNKFLHNNRALGLSVLGTGALVILICFFTIFGGRSINKTINEYLTVALESKTELALGLFPDDIINLLYDSYYADEDNIGLSQYSIKQLIEQQMATLAQKNMNSINSKIGLEWDYVYYITNEVDLGKDYIENYFANLYGIYNVSGYSAAKMVDFKVDIIQNGQVVDNIDYSLTLVKKGSSWYILI